ncbi:MAG: nucleobase:cation symporter-2 family protein [Collimonas sp.]
MNATTHPVDRKLPAPILFALGLQHVLVMYAGAIAVPLIIGGALKLPKDQIAFLINADLFCCGLVTLIQSLGVWKFGIRMPVMMGVTFAAVGPMLAMASNPDLGILAIYGTVIAAGVFGIVVAPLMSRLVRYFPPIVTGSIITVIGISLMRVGINWAAGGNPTVKQMVDGVLKDVPNPSYGAPENLAVALLVLIAIVLITKHLKGFLSNIAVLLGLIIGFVVALVLGKVNFAGLAEAHWFDVIIPFRYGMPTFDIGSIIAMCMVMIVVMVESTGMFLALSDITGKKISQEDIANGLRVDGLGTIIGGIFNTFPYTSFSQNVGLVGVTGIRSRYVCVAAGMILMAFGFFPKMAVVAASVPQFVLGGAGLVMFGMVAATGIKILARVDFETNRSNLFIVAISIGSGMISLVAPTFFHQLPKWTSTILHSDILIAAVVSFVLNLYLNGRCSAEDGHRNAIAGAQNAAH